MTSRYLTLSDQQFDALSQLVAGFIERQPEVINDHDFFDFNQEDIHVQCQQYNDILSIADQLDLASFAEEIAAVPFTDDMIEQYIKESKNG